MGSNEKKVMSHRDRVLERSIKPCILNSQFTNTENGVKSITKAMCGIERSADIRMECIEEDKRYGLILDYGDFVYTYVVTFVICDYGIYLYKVSSIE